MCRGVFAITWFFLLSSSLITVQTMYVLLMNNEIKNQGVLMDSEEAFFIARNFEFDFRKAVLTKSMDEFFNYWKTKGNLTYGYLVDFPEKHCSQTKQSFRAFISQALIEKDDVFLFSPMGMKQTCVTLEVNYKDFKTFGIIDSQECISKSSPFRSC